MRRVHTTWAKWSFYLPLSAITVEPPSSLCAGLLLLFILLADRGLVKLYSETTALD
jgi:hypothetical protein